MDTKENCPVEATLELIGGKYKALILWHLSEKKLRFSELRKAVQNDPDGREGMALTHAAGYGELGGRRGQEGGQKRERAEEEDGERAGQYHAYFLLSPVLS